MSDLLPIWKLSSRRHEHGGTSKNRNFPLFAFVVRKFIQQRGAGAIYRSSREGRESKEGKKAELVLTVLRRERGEQKGIREKRGVERLLPVTQKDAPLVVLSS